MKYFKIVNPKGHHGLVYHEGYNEDQLPFNPSGDCEAGGIYFASEDIFAFLEYGTEVYEVEPVGEVYENPGEPKKYKAHAVNLKYIGETSDVETVKYIVEHGANLRVNNNNWILRWASRNGHLEVVKYLVEQGLGDYDRALRNAAWHGHTGVVRYLKGKMKEGK